MDKTEGRYSLGHLKGRKELQSESIICLSASSVIGVRGYFMEKRVCWLPALAKYTKHHKYHKDIQGWYRKNHEDINMTWNNVWQHGTLLGFREERSADPKLEGNKFHSLTRYLAVGSAFSALQVRLVAARCSAAFGFETHRAMHNAFREDSEASIRHF